MKIDSVFDINEKVYYINDDRVKFGRVVQISLSIDTYGCEIKKFVVLDDSDDHEDFCDKYHHELHRNIDSLIKCLRKTALDTIKKSKEAAC